MRTMSELSLRRSKMICVPSGVPSNTRDQGTPNGRREPFHPLACDRLRDEKWTGEGIEPLHQRLMTSVEVDMVTYLRFSVIRRRSG
jgi:hypothetical protein